jgi:hypothetical protein
MSDEIEYEPVTLAYLRASAEKDWAAELAITQSSLCPTGLC